jgi:hypothetical protein
MNRRLTNRWSRSLAVSETQLRVQQSAAPLPPGLHQVPGFSSAITHPASASIVKPAFSLPHGGMIRVLALTHSRRIILQRWPWLISSSLGGSEYLCRS